MRLTVASAASARAVVRYPVRVEIGPRWAKHGLVHVRPAPSSAASGPASAMRRQTVTRGVAFTGRRRVMPIFRARLRRSAGDLGNLSAATTDLRKPPRRVADASGQRPPWNSPPSLHWEP